ncbi:QWRF motif-containing protein 3-like protein [Tanacetum coccineum]
MNSMKKADSLALPSKWGSMSGRSDSPPMMTNSSFASSKPPTSPSKIAKKNFLHMGLDMIKNRKYGSEPRRDMERRHASNVSTTKYCLEAIACRAPLIEGAKADCFPICAELAKVAIEEKLLLERGAYEHFAVISRLEEINVGDKLDT